MTAFRYLLCLVPLLASGCRSADFEAQEWQPPKNPGLLNTLPPNNELLNVRAYGGQQWQGPEDIAIDAEGRVYAGSLSGKIQRLDTKGQPEFFAQMPGQVLGMDFDAEGYLYACVDLSGLWRIGPDGKAQLVVDSYHERKFGLLDDVKVGIDGMVYFSEATAKYSMANHMLDILEGYETGALFRYDPKSKVSEQLLDHLGFANGVAVAPDASYVLVNETSRYRIRKYWLSGPKAGKNEIFLDNLPGFPDGLSHFTDGKFWIAFISIRSALLDTVHPRPFFKNILAGLPKDFLPKEKPYGLIASFNEQGEWLKTLQDPDGAAVPGITSVEERQGFLWLGSLHGHELYSIKAN